MVCWFGCIEQRVRYHIRQTTPPRPRDLRLKPTYKVIPNTPCSLQTYIYNQTHRHLSLLHQDGKVNFSTLHNREIPNRARKPSNAVWTLPSRLEVSLSTSPSLPPASFLLIRLLFPLFPLLFLRHQSSSPRSSFMCFLSPPSNVFNSKTHIHNPHWPPHARYHNGQTMSLGLFTGLITYYILFSLLPRTTSPAQQSTHLSWILVLQNLVYLSSLSGILYPGAGWTDPEFGEGKPQMYVFPVLVALTWVGWWMERKRIARGGKVKV